ncbi:MAG TPA: IPExxxVDY family protein [Fluviicola sp.]|nr:IPExxxVDY family protein [Fluviicola sp.]
MSKKKRHVISWDTCEDFDMIGICSHHPDYRLAWSINQLLQLNLAKSNDNFHIYNKKGLLLSEHSYHFYCDESTSTEWYLFKNKVNGKMLIPEKPQVDFFLILRNNILFDVDEITTKLRDTNSVMAVFNFEPSSIPSTELIIFE